MPLYILIMFIGLLLALMIPGILVLLRNPRRLTARVFFFMCLSFSAWTATDFLTEVSFSSLLANQMFNRLAYFTGALLVISIVVWCFSFPGEKIRLPKWAWILLTFMCLFSLTDYIAGKVLLVDGQLVFTNGPLLPLYLVFVIGCVLAWTIRLVQIIRSNTGYIRDQAWLILFGVSVTIIGAASFNVVFPIVTQRYTLSKFGPLFTIFLVFLMMNAIIRHKLFDIRRGITRTVGFVVTVGVVAAFYSLLIFTLGAPFLSSGKITLVNDKTQLLLLIPPTIFVGLTFHSIQQFIAKFTRRIFYQDDFDLRDTLDRLSDTLVAANDIDKIMKDSLKVISEAIKPSSAYFVVFDETGHVYRTITQHTSAPRSTAELVGDIKAVAINPVARDEMTEDQVPRSFVEQDISLALRLGAKDKPRGLLLFGPKQNGRVYSQQDRNLLKIGAKNLDVALENAKRYEQISHFADTMHQEVLKATAKLRKANKELKTLDALKDDFIHMASHQLRTPATSVHEALQMLSHPPMSLSKEERARLFELAEASSEHLVAVVADMLSIARIQAGHLIASKSQVVLQEAAERVLKQTSILADQKHINLIFNKPPEPIQIDLDLPKISEAMTNYIENAIKYSPEQTTVTINLSVQDKKAHFEVTDQGMGVPKEEQKHLFEKFYRAQNARSEQPDGNGIGLFVVKSIAQAHEGDAYYEPLQHGSLFGFWLPIQ